MSELSGAIVAVTGGARGIGLATVRGLVDRGARVWLGDVDGELAAREADAFGAHGKHLDVRDRDSFAAFLDRVRTEEGRLDALVNNAGVMPLGSFLDEDEAITDQTIAVNLRGVIHGMRLALPEMVERGEGHVVNVASLGARIPLPGAAVYTATKFAVLGLTDAVRHELRGTGVTLTTVLPSMVATELASGVASGRGLTAIAPEKVAAGIVGALEGGGGTVVVPGHLDPVTRLASLLPGPADRLVRRVIGDQRALELDPEARAAYERRLAESQGGPSADA